GTFSVTPTSGPAPLVVTATCAGDTISGLVIDFGDGTVIEDVTCPTTLTHTYSKEGSYTITVRHGDKVLTTQTITVASAPIVIEDGKGKPSVLASTGANLLLVILLAAVLSGVVSYFIIRRPFHGDQE